MIRSQLPIGRMWRIAAACTFTFLAFGLVPALAQGEGRKPDPTPQLFFTGDETIGTLPILQGADVIELRRDLPITQPSLCLEGDLADVLNSIVAVRGQAYAQVEPVAPGSTRVRVIFPGKVELTFDRLMIESSTIHVGMRMPDGPRLGLLQAAWNARVATAYAYDQFTELPVLPMSSTGALSLAPLHAHVLGGAGQTFLTAATSPDLLVMRQLH